MKNVLDKRKRGLLIVFEGVDRIGKSTQIKLLKEYFLSIKQQGCQEFAFPDRKTPMTSQHINDLLANLKSLTYRATHLLFSLNRWERREDILNELEKGNNVVVDRYAFSGVVYSVASGADPEWCRYPDQGLPRPDIVFQLNAEIDKLKSREGYGNEVFEKVEFQEKVKINYEKLFHNYKYWRVIDANNTKDDIHNLIIKELEILIKQYESNNDDDFVKNFYPTSIGEDLFMYKDI